MMSALVPRSSSAFSSSTLMKLTGDSGGAAGAAPASSTPPATTPISARRIRSASDTRARLRIVGPPLPSFLVCIGWPLPQFGIG